MRLWKRQRNGKEETSYEKEQLQDQELRRNQQLLKLREESAARQEENSGQKEDRVAREIEDQSLTSEEERAIRQEDSEFPIDSHVDRKKVNYKNKKDCLDYVVEQCEMIAMAEKQLMETKIEYGAVTAYLTDIQKIDQIPLEHKDTLMEAARRILNLKEERNRYQNREVKISEIMYKHLEKYEDMIPSEIVKMKKNEEYEQLIKEDLRNLESEKGALVFEREELDHKKSYIKSISVIASLLIVVLIVMFGLFQAKFEMDVTLPLLLTVLVGGIAVFLIFIENNRTNEAIQMNERKLNKAIGLINKVKIKFVNNRNNLDYTYQKFRVHASKEFSYLWEEYVKLKDETRRYQQNTELLEYYQKSLIHELKEYDVEDAEVWIYQPLALLDGKEMVEVRHRLNHRRQKLREQIDYNNSILRASKQEIQKVVKQAPQLEYQVDKLLNEYKIELDHETL